MARNPYEWFKFYFRDWLESERVRCMSPAAQGLYIRALSLQAIYGSIPADVEELSIALQVKFSNMSAWNESLVHFESEDSDTGKRLYNKKLRGLLNDKQKLSKTRSKCAANAKQMLSNSKAIDEAKDSTCVRARRAHSKSKSLSKSLSSFLEDSFNTFWAAYPNRKDKAAAFKSWLKLNPDEALAKQITEHVQHRVLNDYDWTKDDGRFVPMGSTFLNNSRWLDEYKAAKTFGKPVTNASVGPVPEPRVVLARPSFDTLDSEVWANATAEISEEDPDAHDEWISPLTPLGIADGEVWLCADSEFSRDWVARNYKPLLTKCLGMSVVVVTDSDFCASGEDFF